MANLIGCPKPSFTEQLAHATVGGGIALAALILAVAAVVLIVWKD